MTSPLSISKEESAGAEIWNIIDLNNFLQKSVQAVKGNGAFVVWPATWIWKYLLSRKGMANLLNNGFFTRIEDGHYLNIRNCRIFRPKSNLASKNVWLSGLPHCNKLHHWNCQFRNLGLFDWIKNSIVKNKTVSFCGSTPIPDIAGYLSLNICQVTTYRMLLNCIHIRCGRFYDYCLWELLSWSDD